MDTVEILIMASSLGGWAIAMLAVIPIAMNINLVMIGTKLWLYRKMGKPVKLGLHVTKDKLLTLSEVTVDRNNQVTFKVRGRPLPYDVQPEGIFYSPTVGTQAMIAVEGRSSIYDPTKEISLVDPRNQEMIMIEAQYSEPSQIKAALAEVKRNSFIGMALTGIMLLAVGYVIIQLGAVQEAVAVVGNQAASLSQNAAALIDAAAQMIPIGGTSP